MKGSQSNCFVLLVSSLSMFASVNDVYAWWEGSDKGMANPVYLDKQQGNSPYAMADPYAAYSLDFRKYRDAVISRRQSVIEAINEENNKSKEAFKAKVIKNKQAFENRKKQFDAWYQDHAQNSKAPFETIWDAHSSPK